MSKTVDRRVVRTKQALRGALTSLLRTKSYDQITVEDILSKADVGRSTFYSHCHSKEDLLRRGLQMLRTELGEPAQTGQTEKAGRGFAFSLRMLEHVAEHRKVFPSISRGRGREVVLQELRSVSLALLREELASAPPDTSIPRELTEELIVGAFMSLLVFWLEHNAERTPAEIDAQFQQFILQGIGKRRLVGASAKPHRN
jgi:AcrR family transcriptional regulator